MQLYPMSLHDAIRQTGSTAVFRAGLPARSVARVSVAALPLNAAALSALREHAARRRPIDLVLASHLGLTKTVTIPHAARHAASGAIDIQLRQQMPSRAAGLIWRSQPLPRERDIQPYRVHIFRQQDITDLITAATATGAEVRCVTLDVGYPTPPLFARRTHTDRITTLWHGLTAALILAALVGVLALQGREVAALELRTATLEAEIAALLDSAASAQANIAAQDASAADLQVDVARFNTDYRRFPVLADLTNRLGDGVWISALTLDGDVMRLAGFSRADLSDTVSLLQDAPWAADIVIDGPVVVDMVRQENRFQLRATLQSAMVPQ